MILKFFLKKILPANLIKIIVWRYIYYEKFKIFLKEILFNIKYLFKKNFISTKKVKFINQDLILVGQIQRSGGTLISQLFDGHNELYSYPSELILSKSKSDWSYKFNFITYNTKDSVLKKSIEKKKYKKLSENSTNLTFNSFKFDTYYQRKIFDSFKQDDLRSNFNAYFTSFFNSFQNYNGKFKNKKYVTGHLPKFFFIVLI